MPSIKDSLKVTGKLNVKLIGKDGNTIREYNFKNLVVDTGLAHIAQRLSGTPDVMSYMAIGSGTTSPAGSDTTLGSELFRSPLNDAGGITTGATVNYTANFAAGDGTGSVTEAGLFNSASTGDMLCRTTFLAINKGADDTLAVSWTLTIS